MTDLRDDTLLGLRLSPARLGPLVAKRRRDLYGEDAGAIVIEAVPSHDPPAPAVVVRAGGARPLAAWPEPGAWSAGDRVVVFVADDDASRRAFLQWLRRVAETPSAGTVAPVGPDAAGLHKLWCIAAARLRLPAAVRVEVRHDLVGIRLTQVALGLGADLLTGPVESDRALPLAGVTRPTEATRDGLRTLVRQAGLRPIGPAASPEPPPLPAPTPAPEARP